MIQGPMHGGWARSGRNGSFSDISELLHQKQKGHSLIVFFGGRQPKLEPPQREDIGSLTEAWCQEEWLQEITQCHEDPGLYSGLWSVLRWLMPRLTGSSTQVTAYTLQGQLHSR